MTEAWALIVGGLLTSLVALVSLVIAKENKTSEFRQAWINDLRTVFCELNELLAKIHNEHVEGIAEEAAKKMAERGRVITHLKDADYTEFHRLRSEVKLRLNSINPYLEEVQLLKAIEDSEEEVFKNKEEFINHYNHLLSLQGVVLKTEWTRVKKGESIYKGLVKSLNLSVVLSLLMCLFLIVYFLSLYLV